MKTTHCLWVGALAAGCTPALATSTPGDPSAPPIVQSVATTEAGPGRSSVLVEEAVGTNRARASAAAARVQTRIDECQLGSSGVVHARVSRDPADGALRVSIRRGRPLRATERQCVIAALESVELDALDLQESPSERPSDMYVLLRVEW